MGFLLAISRILNVYTRDGKLIGEPYKGYLYDKHLLDNTPHTIFIEESHGFDTRLIEIYNPEYTQLENYIESQKFKWKCGTRW